MCSEISEPTYPTSTTTKTVVIPTIPHDIIDEVLGHLRLITCSDIAGFLPASTLISLQARALLPLRTCALVSKSWAQLSRRHLFHTVLFTSRDMDRWLKTFLVPEESPAHHVRDLHVWIGAGPVDEESFEYTPQFRNVERLSLLGYGRAQPYRRRSFWKLPHSTTSLTIDTDRVTLVQVRDIIEQLPNLDDLSLSGLLFPTGEDVLPGTGTTLRGRFGGRLLLRGDYAGEDVINMLLEIPSGLRFTEVQVGCTHEHLPSVVRLTEACDKTLVKLSHTVVSRYGCESPQQSFDFSGFANLQEVNFVFTVGRTGGGLLWISKVLSTLRPTTSPRLSAVQLNFSDPPTDLSIKTLIKNTANDLRRVASEVSRIEREFEGVVKFTVLRDSVFGAVLCALNIFQHHTR